MKLPHLFLLLIGLVSACSPFRVVRNESDRSATWAAYRTYAFVDTARIDPTPRDSYQAAMEQVKQAVAIELKNRGYEPTKDNPDLLVNLGAVVKERTQTRQTTIREAPLYIGQRRYSWRSQEVPTGTYQEGTVNLHIVDAQRNALLWDVAVSSVLNRRTLDPEQISNAVANVFERFPGKK
ncbi:MULTISPECIES: DUF4136 domain-containing protein [Spirosoma]|uniref:DUF4136 domain-containing protein n=1 Tax=Spirosoma sordidisoli TaxID=2502893 RepID=A0A4Q2UUL5_9BACT|nr:MULTISPECIES: DUF4136 domain-containing protein [Spirosoma]RYC71535.1 DUF4136 domain-containing protein [Spirosoma sordidisoli]